MERQATALAELQVKGRWHGWLDPDFAPIVVKGDGVVPPNQALIVDGEISVQVPALSQSSAEV